MRLFSVLWLNRLVFYSALVTGAWMAFDPTPGGLQATINDKLLHASGFAAMAFLSHLAYPHLRFIWLVLLLAAFGLAIEVVQFYLPYRHFSLWDFTADILGIGMYFLILAKPVTIHLLRYRFVPD